MARTGRPPEPFDQVVADAICELLAEGWSLRKVIDEGSGQLFDDDSNEIIMPSMRVFYRWIREYPEFRKQYALAKDESVDAYFEELQDLGEQALKDVRKAEPKTANAIVQAYKLKADNIKWSVSKLKPKKYGERINITNEEEEDDPFDGLTTEELRKIAESEK